MIAYLLLIPALIWATVSDIKTRVIPDTVHILIIVSGLILIIGYGQQWKTRVAALLIAGTATLVLSLCVAGIGGGDIKMMAAIAFALGLLPGLYSLMISLLLALLFIMLSGHKDAPVPLAPFLSAGCVAVLTIQKVFPEKLMEMI